MEYLTYRNYNIEITRKTKNKNIYFRVKSDGAIVITCPFHIETKALMVYLDNFINKIEKKYDQSALTKVDYDDQGTFFYLGERLIIEYLQSHKDNVQIKEGKLLVFMKEPSFEQAKKVIDAFIKKEATKILTERFNQIIIYFDLVGFIPQLKIRKMTSKFGVCYYKKQSITLSTLLLHYDYECIDYVIIHELVHFIQPNHSKKFYYLVEKYYPNYKNAEAKLKNLKISF